MTFHKFCRHCVIDNVELRSGAFSKQRKGKGVVAGKAGNTKPRPIWQRETFIGQKPLALNQWIYSFSEYELIPLQVVNSIAIASIQFTISIYMSFVMTTSLLFYSSNIILKLVFFLVHVWVSCSLEV